MTQRYINKQLKQFGLATTFALAIVTGIVSGQSTHQTTIAKKVDNIKQERELILTTKNQTSKTREDIAMK